MIEDPILTDPHSPEIPEHRSPPLRELPFNMRNLARYPLLALIRLYQKTISKPYRQIHAAIIPPVHIMATKRFINTGFSKAVGWPSLVYYAATLSVKAVMILCHEQSVR